MFFKNISVCCLLIALLSLVSCSVKSDNTVTKELFVMDTVCSVKTDKDAAGLISDSLKSLDNTLDSVCENGEIHNLSENRSLVCSDSLCDFVRKSLDISAEYGDNVTISGGAATLLWKEAQEENILPDEKTVAEALGNIGDDLIVLGDNNEISLKNDCKLDSGAFAKGYALDVCKDILDKQKSQYAVVSMTSSILLYGKKPDGENFKVKIRNPNGEGFLGTVETPACFISTSGGYERFFTINNTDYCHIIDLSTGFPTTSDLTSVTVFCDSGILSDYLSTKIFLEGSENIGKHLESPNYKVAAFDKNGNSYISSGVNFSR